MKNSILKTVFFLGILVNSSAYAQTKQETMDWLKENAYDLTYDNESGSKEYVTVTNFISVKNDSISFHRGVFADGCFSNYRIRTVSVKDIRWHAVDLFKKKQSESTRNGKTLYIRVNKGAKVRITDENRCTGKESNSFISLDYFSIEYKNHQEDNYMRVLKAIMHLSKLSGGVEYKEHF